MLHLDVSVELGALQKYCSGGHMLTDHQLHRQRSSRVKFTVFPRNRFIPGIQTPRALDGFEGESMHFLTFCVHLDTT